MTLFDKYKPHRNSGKDKDIVRAIPISPQIRHIIREVLQTQDIFHIGFYSDSNEFDIYVYEFKNVSDIFYEVKDRLRDLNLRERIKVLVILNINQNAELINNNIKFFGVAHFLG